MREKLDLVLMDLNMPACDGITATRALRSRPATAGVPVVALTAHCSDPSWRDRALEAGRVDRVREPVDSRLIDRTLERSAEQARAPRTFKSFLYAGQAGN